MRKLAISGVVRGGLPWPVPIRRECAVRDSAMKREPNTVRSKDQTLLMIVVLLKGVVV
jgi:hypothetical protein